MNKMKFKCECGFEFAELGEFRNCPAFVAADGRSGVTCPECGTSCVDGQKVIIKSPAKEKEKTIMARDTK